GPLSVAAFQEAVRAGRTLATNGPWLELRVDGNRPGDVVAAAPGTQLRVTVAADGDGVDAVELLGPDGVVAGGAGPRLATTVTVDGPLWLAGAARGAGHPAVLGPRVYAHTSPVHIEVDGKRATRAGSGAWCLDWLDRL